jgi:hypothetical protein
VADVVCPFCAAPQPARPESSAAQVAGSRLSRMAIFAAGAALAGMSAAACSSTQPPTDAGTGGTTATGGGGTTAGSGGSGGSAVPDAGRPDGPVPIYSAVFPPEKPAKRRNG